MLDHHAHPLSAWLSRGVACGPSCARTACGVIEERGARRHGPGGADGPRVPATRALPGHVLAAPSVPKDSPMSPTRGLPTDGTKGRLRASPGPLRCFPRRRPLPPGPRSSAPRFSTHQELRDATGPTFTTSGAPTEPHSPAITSATTSLLSLSSSTNTHILGPATGPAFTTSGAPTICVRGAGADWRGKQRRGPGLARRRPVNLEPRTRASVTSGCRSGQMGRRARALGGPASQGPAARRPPPRPNRHAPRS